MADILFAKTGKSITFDSKRWSPYGGFHEAICLLYILAKRFPQHNFWIVGHTDYHKIFPNGLLPNIKSIWDPIYYDNDDPNQYLKNPWIVGVNEEEQIKVREKFWSYPHRTIKKLGIKPALMIDMMGILYENVFYGIKPVIKKNMTGYRQTLSSTERYNAPITYLENMFLTEYDPVPELVHVMTDSNHVHINNTLIKKPDVFLGQTNKHIVFPDSKHYFPRGIEISYDNSIDLVYAGLESMILNYMQSIKEFPKKNGFAVMQNYIPTGKSNDNHDIAKKYHKYLDGIDCKIYGKWPDKYKKLDHRLVGPVHPEDLYKVLMPLKYSLCIATEDNWITPKFLECLHYGVIPFVTDDYAIGTEYIPDWLRVKNSDELWEKIQILENNQEQYRQLFDMVINIPISSDMYSGNYLLKFIKKYISFDFGTPVEYDKPISELYHNDYKKAIEKETDWLDELFTR